MTPNFLDIINESCQILAKNDSISKNVSKIMGVICRKLESKRSLVLIYDSESEAFSPLGFSGLSLNEYRKLERNLANKFFRLAVNQKTNLVIETNETEKAIEFLFSGQADCYLMVTPIVEISPEDEQNCLGLFVIELRKTQSSSNVVLFCNSIAGLISGAIRLERVKQLGLKEAASENNNRRIELKERYNISKIIGNSNEMRRVYEQVEQVARSNATVLLRGESGTGKEMIANSIHYNSLRSKKPFVAINCAALPETLIEAELFGYEKGAFTGADKLKLGRFELANGGTMFLDEIGDMPMQTQIKLLRVIQERKIERLGGTNSIDINVRIVAATNKNLEIGIADGLFREDLFYRLNVFTIFLPPLRDRKSDILLLAEHFLEKYEAEYGKRIRRLSTSAIDMLANYHYPGNVRELENAIERAVIVCDSNVIHGHHLPPTLQTAEVSNTEPCISFSEAVQAFESGLITDALKSTSGNIAKAARILDITERVIGYKIKNYNIDPLRFRVKKFVKHNA